MTEPKPDDAPSEREVLQEQERVGLIVDGLRDPEDHIFIEGRDISYKLDAEADESVNADHPGEWMPTSSLNLAGKDTGEISLSIWVWEGIPETFKKIVLYHEITEGLLVLNYGVLKHQAHALARRHHEAYAQNRLTPEQQAAFAAWDKNLDHGCSKYEDE